jgi:hypothetical protein
MLSIASLCLCLCVDILPRVDAAVRQLTDWHSANRLSSRPLGDSMLVENWLKILVNPYVDTHKTYGASDSPLLIARDDEQCTFDDCSLDDSMLVAQQLIPHSNFFGTFFSQVRAIHDYTGGLGYWAPELLGGEPLALSVDA